MKQLPSIGIIMMTFVFAALADTTDPVAYYKNLFGLETTHTLYRWSADLDGDGNNEVFLSLKAEYQEDKRDGQMPSWLVCLAKHDGSGFVPSVGVDQGDGIGFGFPGIDPEKLYVGQITQLGKRGIVTMQFDHPRKGDDVAYIYAYTVEGDHLKRTLLVQYEPSESNAIYNQYLTDSQRTHITLQEVTP